MVPANEYHSKEKVPPEPGKNEEKPKDDEQQKVRKLPNLQALDVDTTQEDKKPLTASTGTHTLVNLTMTDADLYDLLREEVETEKEKSITSVPGECTLSLIDSCSCRDFR